MKQFSISTLGYGDGDEQAAQSMNKFVFFVIVVCAQVLKLIFSHTGPIRLFISFYWSALRSSSIDHTYLLAHKMVLNNESKLASNSVPRPGCIVYGNRVILIRQITMSLTSKESTPICTLFLWGILYGHQGLSRHHTLHVKVHLWWVDIKLKFVTFKSG